MSFPLIRCEYTEIEVEAERTSDPDSGYNCVAWAFGRNDINWWPSFPGGGWAWPVPFACQGHALNEFENLFAVWGWEPCQSSALESGYDKIALYADGEGSPTHLARMIRPKILSGSVSLWTSKLGPGIDITHELDALEGDHRFGKVYRIYRKPALLD